MRVPLSTLVDRLSEAPIEPPPPPVEERATWHRLKVGATLRSKVEVVAGALRHPPGTPFTVTRCTNRGITLVGPCTVQWTLPQWETHWERVRSPAKRRKVDGRQRTSSSAT